MKVLTLTICTLLGSVSLAGQVPIAWPPTNAPQITSYRVYWRAGTSGAWQVNTVAAATVCKPATPHCEKPSPPPVDCRLSLTVPDCKEIYWCIHSMRGTVESVHTPGKTHDNDSGFPQRHGWATPVISSVSNVASGAKITGVNFDVPSELRVNGSPITHTRDSCNQISTPVVPGQGDTIMFRQISEAVMGGQCAPVAIYTVPFDGPPPPPETPWRTDTGPWP